MAVADINNPPNLATAVANLTPQSRSVFDLLNTISQQFNTFPIISGFQAQTAAIAANLVTIASAVPAGSSLGVAITNLDTALAAIATALTGLSANEAKIAQCA
jgi:hypothetical protein